ncbi:hypothetical protein Tsp_13094 [Trichinella spiralis]|uniref:hypothetical protein n=1 Tax=Trichinella spiralis TaxID=6334 RepID=UPI0001EFDE81|nr:hypothetical protein Tsp_13094 [Trichinella spiralis]
MGKHDLDGSIWPACCQHPALDPSRYVAALSLNDRFSLVSSTSILFAGECDCVCALVGIPYVQFYGTFIVQCPRPHLRQQRQQKMKKPDISKSPFHSLPSRKQPITTCICSSGNMLPIEETQHVQLSEIFRCNWRIWFSIFRLLRIEDFMRLSYASREINAMAQSYFKLITI